MILCQNEARRTGGFCCWKSGPFGNLTWSRPRLCGRPLTQDTLAGQGLRPGPPAAGRPSSPAGAAVLVGNSLGTASPGPAKTPLLTRGPQQCPH